MTDEELARATSPVRGVFGLDGSVAEYTTEVLPSDVERVRESRRKQHLGVRMRSLSPGHQEEWIGDVPPSRTSLLESADAGADRKNGWVFGADNRWWTLPSQAYLHPQVTSILIENPWEGGRSSATMVGHYTAIGAAHGFWNNTISNWYGCSAPPCKPLDWRIARVQSSAGNKGSAKFNGGYWVTVPEAFTASPWAAATHFPFDYAAIDFSPAGWNPGTVWGFMAVGIGSTSDYAAAAAQQHAYDAYKAATNGCYDSLPGNPVTLPPQDASQWTYGGATYTLPSMLSRSHGAGSLQVWPSNTWMLRSYMDATPGASGSGLLANIFARWGDPTLFYVGDWGVGGIGNWGVSGMGSTECWHGARIFDWGVLDFLKLYTVEYN